MDRKAIVPNYRAMFALGIIFLPSGIATGTPGMWVMGLVFLLVGLKHKGKWGQETKWADYPPRLKKIKFIVAGGLTILMLAAIAYFMFWRVP